MTGDPTGLSPNLRPGVFPGAAGRLPGRGAAVGPLSRDAEGKVRTIFQEQMARPVGLDVWTRQHPEPAAEPAAPPDRDPCDHCEEQLALLRQFVRINPLLSITAYDLDRHAARAADLGVDLAPTTMVRAGGRSVQFVGMSDGTLLRPLIDVITYLSSGTTPLNEGPRAVLAALTEPIHLDLLVAPYDQFSDYQMRLVGAMAAECRALRVRIIDATEYPLFAERLQVAEVPMMTIEGRPFIGLWDEDGLAEQIRRIAAGDPEPVERAQLVTIPFVTEAAARDGASTPLPPDPGLGGLITPGG